MRLEDIYHIALSGQAPGPEAASALCRAAREEPARLCALAGEMRDRLHGRSVELCAIVNAKSGRCSEDCAFCAQSGHHRTGAPVHPFIGARAVAEASYNFV